MKYQVGIDVGGTFTDFVLLRPSGDFELLKVPSTLQDQSIGVMNGIARLAEIEGLSVADFLANTATVVHGTTTGDNTMIEMNGAVTGLITSQGHRDQIEIRRGYKEDLWDPTVPAPIPIAPRRRRFAVPERLDANGNVLTPLDENAVRDAVRHLKKQGVESIAVCYLFSFLRPDHELRTREIINDEYPEAKVSLSHQVMPTTPEFERTSTTLIDAYIGPKVEIYLQRLTSALRTAGYHNELLIMQFNGGVLTASALAGRAVAIMGSGPIGGVNGACHVAQSCGVKDFIAIDMGGTSYEVCLVQNGHPEVSSGWNWQHRYVVGLPMVKMYAIGAGGGSAAYVQEGALKVGPESAKADPGPICYGQGGTRVTVTDANLLLGYINPKALCGGRFRIEGDNVELAIEEQIGKPLGLSTIDAAHGVFRIVNANMSNAIRRLSSNAGKDPRDFDLVVYGGNGPVHAGMQAAELGIKRMIVPRTSPAFSAFGLLIANYILDRQEAYIKPWSQVDAAHIAQRLADLKAACRAELAPTGMSAEQLVFEPALSMCYPGQTAEESVPVADDRPDLADVVERFHAAHEANHGYAMRGEAPMIRGIRMRAKGVKPNFELPRLPRAETHSARDAQIATRRAYFGEGFADTPVYDGDRLTWGHRIEGPAIVEEKFTTIVLYPGHVATVDERGNYIIDLP